MAAIRISGRSATLSASEANNGVTCQKQMSKYFSFLYRRLLADVCRFTLSEEKSIRRSRDMIAAIRAVTSSPRMYGTRRRRTSSRPRAPTASIAAKRSIAVCAVSNSWTSSGRNSSVIIWASALQFAVDSTQDL